MVIFPFLDDVKRPTDYRKGQQPTWKRWKIARPGKPTKNAWENHHAIDGFLSTISTGPFSIAMFVYQMPVSYTQHRAHETRHDVV
jgi:hypothetical protein